MSFLDGPRFIEGNIYTRSTDINEPFGGSPYSGISPSKKFPAIFIFTGTEGKQYGYRDEWDTAEQVYTYTGEGQVGDMTFTKGNLAIRDHVFDGRSLHLFKKVSRKGGLYAYMGEMECATAPIVRGPDRDGSERNVIQFQLVRLRAIDEDSVDLVSEATPDTSLQELRERAYFALGPSASVKKEAVRAIYDRSRHVVAYALKRADGKCEYCEQRAPFRRPNGQPYLEVHHIDRISDGGLDAPNKVAAICPTCHRLIHHGEAGKKTNDDLRPKIAALEGLLAKQSKPT